VLWAGPQRPEDAEVNDAKSCSKYLSPSDGPRTAAIPRLRAPPCKPGLGDRPGVSLTPTRTRRVSAVHLGIEPLRWSQKGRLQGNAKVRGERDLIRSDSM